jgi:hypothetical protein
MSFIDFCRHVFGLSDHLFPCGEFVGVGSIACIQLLL